MTNPTITVFDASKVDVALLAGKVYVLKTLTRRMTELQLYGHNWLTDETLAGMEVAAEELVAAVRKQRQIARQSQPSEK